MDNLGGFQQISAAIAGKRVADSTRKSYASKMKTWKAWLTQHKPQYIVNDDIALPLDTDTMLAFFGSIAYKDAEKKHLRAASTVYAYYSALKFEYSERKIPFNASVDVQQFLDGFQNTVAQAREDGQLPTFEGKQPLSMKAFRQIAIFGLKGKECFYAHLYLVLCWNLMGRTTSIGSLHYANIGWSNDALQITLPRHKGDQAGQNTKPKHLFANLEAPELCPVLAMAVYSFSYGHRGNNIQSHKLFTGPDPEGSFTR